MEKKPCNARHTDYLHHNSKTKGSTTVSNFSFSMAACTSLFIKVSPIRIVEDILGVRARIFIRFPLRCYVFLIWPVRNLMLFFLKHLQIVNRARHLCKCGHEMASSWTWRSKILVEWTVYHWIYFKLLPCLSLCRHAKLTLNTCLDFR
jgi:hypothetical protein